MRSHVHLLFEEVQVKGVPIRFVIIFLSGFVLSRITANWDGWSLSATAFS